MSDHSLPLKNSTSDNIIEKKSFLSNPTLILKTKIDKQINKENTIHRYSDKTTINPLVV